MRALITRFTAFYGSNQLHLLGTIAALALAGYVVIVLSGQALWNPQVWWQSIAVWFLAAIIAHDLILFPLYALADRSVTAVLAAVRVRRAGPSVGVPRVSPLNYPRVPDPGDGAVASAVLTGMISDRDNRATSRPPGRTNNPLCALAAAGGRPGGAQRAGLRRPARRRRTPRGPDRP